VTGIVVVMKRLAIVTGTLLLAANAFAEEEPISPAMVPTGSIVRIVAQRPPISLGHAELVQVSSNTVTLRHRRDKFTTGDRFTVALSNILEFKVLELAKAPEGAAGAKGAASKTNLWDKIKGYWK